MFGNGLPKAPEVLHITASGKISGSFRYSLLPRCQTEATRLSFLTVSMSGLPPQHQNRPSYRSAR